MIAARYGLDGGGGRSMVEAAEMIGLTRSRGYQLEGAALARLRGSLGA